MTEKVPDPAIVYERNASSGEIDAALPLPKIGRWLVVKEQLPIAGQMTLRWNIYATTGELLGEVRWCPRWRKYAFVPSNYTWFEEECLNDIARFLLSVKSRRRDSEKETP